MPTRIALSRDGKTLALAVNIMRPTLWDVAADEEIRALAEIRPAEGGGPVRRNVRTSPDAGPAADDAGREVPDLVRGPADPPQEPRNRRGPPGPAGPFGPAAADPRRRRREILPDPDLQRPDAP